MKAVIFFVSLLYLLSGLSLVTGRVWGSWLFLSLGAFLNFIAIALRWYTLGYFPAVTFYDSLLFFALFSSLSSLYLSRKGRSEASGFTSVLSFLLILPALFLEPPKVLIPPSLKSFWLFVHSTLSFMGYGALSVSFVVSVVYLLQDWSLREKKKVVSHVFGSLEALDRANYVSLALGFPLLTLGIITGSLWAEKAWGSYWSWDPKETWSLISWLIYAACIHQRMVVGWRGRKGAYLAIVGFLAIAFSFFVVNLVFPGLHTYAG